jgi:BirA family biotin operon repressor/biotin-[acetyl-CoA-carboxylase] ligase
MTIPYIEYTNSHRLQEVDSTNNYCKTSNVKNGEWVTSELQSNGRGRGSNKWDFLGNGNIFFSAKVQIELDKIPSLPLVSLFIGSATLRTIRNHAVQADEFSLKWPNDVYRMNKKIAGVLLEANTKNEIVELIIGIGINLVTTGDKENYNYATLYETEFDHTQKEKILHNLVENLNVSMQKIYFRNITEELSWIESNSFLKDKMIQARVNKNLINGKFAGYSLDGFLLLNTESGIVTLVDTDPEFKIN